MRGEARALPDRELQALGRRRDRVAGTQRQPAVGGEEEADPGAVDRQHRGGGAGEPLGQQLGGGDLRRRGGQFRAEPFDQGHRSPEGFAARVTAPSGCSGPCSTMR